jgi:prepilin-type processing-associated H-X9-DG protein
MHGNGNITYADGTYYSGGFKNGKMDGNGKRYYENGDKYTGDWKEDMRHGSAIFFEAKIN